MPQSITVRRNFVVPSLLEIENSAFADWYSHGLYWSMFGDCQERGSLRDCYIIDNIARGILNGWYVDRSSGWFPMIGFKLGMLHGGFLCQPGDTLVVLTDPDFTKGYHVGRDYALNEAPLENRVFSDQVFNDNVHEWALGYHLWHEPNAVLRYCLGCRVGELSAAAIPGIALISPAATQATVSL